MPLLPALGLTTTPVPDLARFLVGSYELARRILCTDGTHFDVHGRAEFSATGSREILYVERATLESDHGPVEVSRSHRYRLTTRTTADLYLSDGTFFHRLDLRVGRSAATHLCGEDRYRGLYVADGADLLVRWHCLGPYKRYISTSRLSRLSRDEVTDR